MDEASKQDLRDQIAKQVWDFEINEQRGAKVSTGMAPWPDDARIQPYCQWAYRHADFTLPLVLRLITEAEGRVHAQAIAAAAKHFSHTDTAGRLVCDCGLAVGSAGKWYQHILALTRPAAELRARIEVLKEREDEFRDTVVMCTTFQPKQIGLLVMSRTQELKSAIAALETQLAALEGGKS